MEFLKRTIKGSPYVGLFGVVTDEFALLPNSMERKEINGLEEELKVPVICSYLAGTSLNGIFMAANGKKAVIPHIVEEEEVSALEKRGIEVLMLEGPTALGNLIAVNNNGGIVSRLFRKKSVKDMEDFFGIKIIQESVANTDIPGAAIALTNKGFIAHPNISEKEFERAEKVLGVEGVTSTSNYGDMFPGNNILANSNAAVIGIQTSGPELARIDTALRGDA